jgi:hypothetical protein
MATNTPRGGFVITMNQTNTVGQIQIDDAMLLKVAKALGIPERASKLDIEKRVSDIRSIYIFRGQ